MFKRFSFIILSLFLISPLFSQESSSAGISSETSEEQTAVQVPDASEGTSMEETVNETAVEVTADAEAAGAAGSGAGDAILPELEEPAATAGKTPILEQYFPVEGLSQWQYEYDISDLEEGRYNLIVRGIDSAGNTVESTAVDIFVDPDSDLPTASLTYPSNNMVVSGDLNILGSARDDDGVDYVEVRLADGDYVWVEGGEFWSYDLKTDGLVDGEYSLAVRATDINGLTGKEKVIRFHIDRTIPEFQVTSHANGDLVSGRITIEGSLEDGNGLESLSYSLDGGTTFEEARLSGKVDEGTGLFSIGINTKELDDGPGVIWFAGTDSRGSSGQAALLLYIDNSPPVLDFLYPAGDSAVNGRFSILGRAFDQVGIASLEYNDGGEENKSISMEPGNPFWKVDVDFTGQKKAEVVFTLTDTAGNSKNFTLKPELDWEGDLPQVDLYRPVEGESTEEALFQGVIIDDDAPAGIIWSVDNGEEAFEESGRFFSIPLKGLKAGEHRVTYRARDSYGIEGVDTTVTFHLLPGPPMAAVEAFLYAGGGEEPFSPGAAVRPDEISGIRGWVSFDGGSGSASAVLAGGESQTLSLRKGEEAGSYSFTVDFPEPLALGYYPIEISALDKLGSESVTSAFFWMEPLTENLSNHDFYRPEGDYAVNSEDEIVLRYIGYPLSELEVPEEASFLDIRQDGEYIRIRGKEAGSLSSLSLKGVSEKGTEFEINNLKVVSDMLAPIFSGITPDSGEYRGKVSIGGSVTDDSGKPEVFYRVGTGEYQTVRLSEEEGDWTFSFSPDPALFAGGGDVLTLLARDGAGRETITRKAYQIPQTGEEPPPVKIFAVSPGKDDVIFPEKQSGNRLLLAAGFTGLESVTSVTWSLDGGDPKPAEGFPVATAVTRVPETGSHSVTFRAEYGEGKSLSASGRFTVAPLPGDMSLETIVTDEQSAVFRQGGDFPVTSSTVINGTISGAGKYTAALKVDGGEPNPLRLSASEGGQSFQIPFKGLSEGLAVYGRHDLEIEVTDSYGRKQIRNVFFFSLLPEGEREVRNEEGLFPLSAGGKEKSFFVDPGKEISFYLNGREIESAGLAEPSEDFSVSFSGRLVKIQALNPSVLEGQSLEVRTIDGDLLTWGPFAVSSDTTSPEMVLSSPSFGGYYQDSIRLEGVVTDDLAVEGIEYSLQNGAFRAFVPDIEVENEDEVNTDPETDPEPEGSLEPGSANGLDPAAGDGDDTGAPEAGGEVEGESDSPGRFEFSGGIDLSELPDGPVHLRLRSSDRAGNSRNDELFFIKDTTAPRLIQILPEGNESVNGRFSFLFRGEDEWSEGFEGNYFLGGEDLETFDGEDSFSISMDLSSFTEVPEDAAFSLTDTSGNRGTLTPELFFQPEGDFPEIQIQIPEEDFLVTSDLTVSGAIFDDDGVESISYTLDDGEPVSLAGGNSFAVPVSFSDLTDNEHKVEIRALDLWGVESEPAVLNFRVSRKAPEAAMTEPIIGKSNRGVIYLKGTAADENGISAVFVSLDNGNSFHRVEGTDEWSYELDTRVLVDGNYMVLIRVEDNYGVQAIYSSLLTIDNTPPRVQLSNPPDGMGVVDELTFQMRISDEIGVEELLYRIKPLEDGVSDESASLEGNLPISEVVIKTIDLAELATGRYSLSVFAYDDAGNETAASRNILKRDASLRSVPVVLFPFQGTAIQGPFVLEGRIEGDFIPEAVTLYRNGVPFDVLTPDSSGYYYRYMEPEELEAGPLEFQFALEDGTGEETLSSLLKLEYSPTGPWIRIDSVRTGDYVSNRPWIKGRVGYLLPPETAETGPDEGGSPLSDKEKREMAKGREVERLEYSLDNGRSFTDFRVREEWKFRLETQSLHDGDLGILVKAVFKNGESAVSQIHVILDDTPPMVAIMTPEEGIAFNGTLPLNGIASDASGLSDVSVMLRKGSKDSYEIPSFIQGLYLDGHFLGATYWEIGAGLTFFDDNVKLQVLFGMAPQGRFDGAVFGLKLLANIATIPYGYYFGPDFDFLSSSVAVGSAFEYFSMSSEDSEQEGLVLGALVAQIELLKVKTNLPFLNTYSLYFEDQLWFISSDVEGGLENRMALGIRVNIF